MTASRYAAYSVFTASMKTMSRLRTGNVGKISSAGWFMIETSSNLSARRKNSIATAVRSASGSIVQMCPAGGIASAIHRVEYP